MTSEFKSGWLSARPDVVELYVALFLWKKQETLSGCTLDVGEVLSKRSWIQSLNVRSRRRLKDEN